MIIKILWQKLKRNLHDYGFLLLIRKLVANIFKPVYFHNIYRVYKIALGNVKVQSDSGTNFDFLLLKGSDLEYISQIEQMEEWLHGKLRIKLDKGGLCLVALDGNRVVGFNLVAFDTVYLPLVEKNKRMKWNKAWSEQISVQRNYRKRGLASALRYRIFHLLRQRGITHLYGGAHRLNVGSLKLAKRVGFKELVDIHFYKIVGYRLWKYERLL